MPLKSTVSTKTEIFELVISHDDIRDMINDPDVGFIELDCPGISVTQVTADQNQEFEILVQKPSGAQFGTPLKMKRSDSIIIRFSKKKLNAEIVNLGDINIDQCYEAISVIPDDVKARGESVLLCDGTRVTFPPSTTTVSATSCMHSSSIRRKKKK
jgi:hypothetical protein